MIAAYFGGGDMIGRVRLLRTLPSLSRSKLDKLQKRMETDKLSFQTLLDMETRTICPARRNDYDPRDPVEKALRNLIKSKTMLKQHVEATCSDDADQILSMIDDLSSAISALTARIRNIKI